MKNKIYKYIVGTLLILGTASCNESAWDTEGANGNGNLDLSSLQIDVNESEKVVTRAASDVSSFIVTVKSSDGQVAGEWKYNEMPEIVTLPAGKDYEVEAKSHLIQDAEWENPFYKGSQVFSIEKGKITKVDPIEAKFSSLKVSIKFDDELKKVLGNDVQVEVRGSNGSSLVYTPTETRAGYFNIEGSTTFAAHFSGTVDGVSTTNETAFTEVNAGEHHILTYKVKGSPEIPEQTGGIGQPGIDMDVVYEVDDVNSNTNVEEDLLDSTDRPGQESPQEPEDPEEDPKEEDPKGEEPIVFLAYESPKLSISQPNKITEESSKNFGNAIVRIICDAGIKDFEVLITSTDAEVFMPAIKDMGLDRFNLTHPADSNTIDNLTNLELPYGDEVIDATTLDFNITSFIELLGHFPGVHTFSMQVTDNNNKHKDLDLQFEVTE